MRCCTRFSIEPMQKACAMYWSLPGKGASYGSERNPAPGGAAFGSQPRSSSLTSRPMRMQRAHMAGTARSMCACAARPGSGPFDPVRRKAAPLARGAGFEPERHGKALHVSAAYLSALEHGPPLAARISLCQRVIGYFNIIWDDAEELQRLAGLSQPRVTVDTAGLDPLATEVANLMARTIRQLDKTALEKIAGVL